jgi:hypothetical protein
LVVLALLAQPREALLFGLALAPLLVLARRLFSPARCLFGLASRLAGLLGVRSPPIKLRREVHGVLGQVRGERAKLCKLPLGCGAERGKLPVLGAKRRPLGEHVASPQHDEVAAVADVERLRLGHHELRRECCEA